MTRGREETMKHHRLKKLADGSFGGRQAMNRAQACVVLSRLQTAF